MPKRRAADRSEVDQSEYVAEVVSKAPALNEAQLAVIRDMVRTTRAEQGLPPRVTEPSALRAIAGLLKTNVRMPTQSQPRKRRTIEDVLPLA